MVPKLLLYFFALMIIFTDLVLPDAVPDPAHAVFHVTDVADRIHVIVIKTNLCIKF